MKIKRHRIIGLFALLLVVLSFPTEVKAYDWNADHQITQYFFQGIQATEGFQKQIWQTLRKAGCTEECTAGIMGNIWRESVYDPTMVQNFKKTWSSSYHGTLGFGLAAWTDTGRQDALAALCDQRGVQWTDIDVQLEFLVSEIKDDGWCKTYHNAGYSFGSAAEFMSCTDIEYACGAFCYNWERPGKPGFSTRLEEAKRVYEVFKGTPIEGDKKEEENKKDGENSSFLDEWGVTGMPSKSKLTVDGKEVELKDSSSLTTGENYSVQTVREGLDTLSVADMITKARVAVCFVGILLIFYSVFLVVAVVFDKTNQFFEVSMVSILTFGRLQYSDDELARGHEGYIQTGKIIKVVAVTLIVGLFLVSGGIFLYLSKFILFVLDKIGKAG